MKKKISRILNCPKCGKPNRFDDSNPFRPFCSPLCKYEDIAAWADETYRVAGEEVVSQDAGDGETEED